MVKHSAKNKRGRFDEEVKEVHNQPPVGLPVFIVVHGFEYKLTRLLNYYHIRRFTFDSMQFNQNHMRS